MICRHDRKDTSQGIGGGLLVWAKEALKVSENESPEVASFNQCCSVRIPLSCGNSLSLTLVYRPHNLYKTPDTEIVNNDKLCEILTSIRGPAVIIGDFNYSDIEWHNLHAGRICSRKFLTTCQDSFLTQHVDFPTRVTSGTTPDLVLSTDESLVHGVTDIGKLGASDHSMLLVEVAGELTPSVSMEEVPDWGKADMEKLKAALAEVDWEGEMTGLDTNQSWDMFKEKLEKAQDSAVPRKRRRIGNRPIWMTKNVLRTIRKKRRLWKVYKETKDHAEYRAYKKVEKTVRDSVRKAKKTFEKNLAKNVKKNPKAFYSYMKAKTSNRQSVGPLKEDGVVVTDDEKQAKILNQFFTSVFTKEDLADFPHLDPFPGDNPLRTTPFRLSWSKKRSKSCAPPQLQDLMGSVPGFCREWWRSLPHRWPLSTRGPLRRGWYRRIGDVRTLRRFLRREVRV
jgi:hypothetical protein